MLWFTNRVTTVDGNLELLSVGIHLARRVSECDHFRLDPAFGSDRLDLESENVRRS